MNYNLSISIFFTIGNNARVYVYWRFAGVFAVLERQSECGRKTR
jgi:hypothetical protein